MSRCPTAQPAILRRAPRSAAPSSCGWGLDILLLTVLSDQFQRRLTSAATLPCNRERESAHFFPENVQKGCSASGEAVASPCQGDQTSARALFSRSNPVFTSCGLITSLLFGLSTFLKTHAQEAPPPKLPDFISSATNTVVSIPNGFKYEVLLQGDLPEPIDLNFAPDGDLWITSRRGYVWNYSFQTKTKSLVTQIKVSWEQRPKQESNERGLHGIEFDPAFASNGYLYLHYGLLFDTGYSNRLSRFTVLKRGNDYQFVSESEKVLLQYPSVKGFHQGGAVGYNPKDGKLYVTTGDNNVSTETKKFFDDPNSPPQSLSDLRGKVLRLNLDGSIPADNPFTRTPGARGEIFSYGHRNPYTINIDDQTGNVYVGEVGYDRKDDFEEINWVQAGGNYGWPRCEGPNLGTFGGDCPLKDAIKPWIYYGHDNGANATSGPFYRANKGRFAFPAQYQNGMFYADFVRRWIRFAPADPVSNAVAQTQPFARGLAGGPLSIKMGPDGGIYFTEYAGWFTGTPRDRISRIIYLTEAK